MIFKKPCLECHYMMTFDNMRSFAATKRCQKCKHMTMDRYNALRSL